MQGARIPFLVRELRPYMLQGTAKKKKKKKKKTKQTLQTLQSPRESLSMFAVDKLQEIF